ncbi:MAG: hypothetical protein V7K73_13660 [Nostoc sp.]
MKQRLVFPRQKVGLILTARNFYERAILLARTLEDSKQEVQLQNQLTKMFQRK